MREPNPSELHLVGAIFPDDDRRLLAGRNVVTGLKLRQVV